jgi:hypothetical protein
MSEPLLQRYVKSGLNETCIFLAKNLLLIGTAQGHLYAYDTKTERQVGINKRDESEFVDNAITAIDVHARRPDYCVVGYEKG